MYCGSLIDKVPVLGKTEEGSEGMSPDPDYGASPEFHWQGGGMPLHPNGWIPTRQAVTKTSKETEPQALTRRKRKLAECADGTLSTDDCPVWHTKDHKLVNESGGKDNASTAEGFCGWGEEGPV